MPSTEQAAVWFALVLIGAVSTNLVLQRERRREDRTASMPLAQGVDPANMRRNRPQTARLTGTALIVAVFIIIGAFRGPLGIG